KSGDALHVFFGPDIVPERHQESTLADIWLRLPQHACRAVQFREMDVPYLNAMMGRAEVVFDDMRAMMDAEQYLIHRCGQCVEDVLEDRFPEHAEHWLRRMLGERAEPRPFPSGE